MQPPHHHSRINLAELKAQLVKKLGPEGSKQYFYFLHRFLSLKLSKVEFNKLCVRIISRENIPLHNQFIRSILRNACSAKTPPPANQKGGGVSRDGAQLGGKDASADGFLPNGSHANVAQASGSPGLLNGGGDMLLLPLSPRKARTGIRDRKTGDRRSALGPNGKASLVLENGDSNPPDIGRPLHSGSENEIFAPNVAKMSIVRRSSDVSAPSCSKDQTELVVRDDGKEASTRSPLRAPLGVPFCPVNVGRAHRALPLSSSSRCIGSYKNSALLDSLTLRERMGKIALIQGLEEVSVDSANILNHGLDAYMKGLIRSCIELVGSRSGHESTKKKTNKHMKHINGLKPGHQEKRSECPISVQDFRVAMELNPRKLGEDWPLLLEKICTNAFDE
ncbi:uncharacterized protein LOC125195741 [Salvia hispanica]|uniref:uncharacterized protein LOC125195741 n=1 Tax=Salvia hispanica TaxID=49212 RepID=UPI002009389D|nr:uncharacterized protein LOC125195741 [Salvia hispanica]XP_047949889.1 uncharacterized protein LOC125195741 [Salvia hispanica]